MDNVLLGFGAAVGALALAAVWKMIYGPVFIAALTSLSGALGLGYTVGSGNFGLWRGLAFTLMLIVGSMFCGIWMELHLQDLRRRIRQLEQQPGGGEAQQEE